MALGISRQGKSFFVVAAVLYGYLLAGTFVWAQAIDKGVELAPQAAAADQPRAGKFIRLAPPLTKAKDRVQRAIEHAMTDARKQGRWPVFVFEIEPGQVDFAEALSLARFLSSPALNGSTTIAYLPETVNGHEVLVALACDEIVMEPDAELGEAGKLEPVIDEGLKSNYQEIASRRRTIPPAVALGMLDPSLEVVQVETDLSREFMLAADLATLKKSNAKPIRSDKVIKKAGAPGMFTAKQLREWGFVSYLAADRRELAQVWKLPAESIHDDMAPDGEWRPARFELTGVVTSEKIRQLQLLIEAQVRDSNVNFIFLWIESPGGSPTDSLNLANYLACIDRRQRRTVAYIPKEARGDAALIALACDQIVMQPGAILGGSGEAELSEEDQKLAARAIGDIAKQKLRSPAIAQAMIDGSVGVFRYVRKTDGLVEFLTEDEAKKLPQPDDWRQDGEVTSRGTPFKVDGDRALEMEIASHVVDNLSEFRARFGLERDPRLVEPSWATTLITALNSPSISWLLLFVGFAALYAELHSPGIGLGGIIGAICFILYFWSAYLGGTAGWLEALLFLTGLVLLLLEIFVLPGVTVFGLAGGLLIVTSLVLASQTFILPHNEYQLEHLQTSLVVLVGAGAATFGAAMLINRLLPHTPLFNRMMLQPPTGEALNELSRRESLAEFADLVGAEGVATTPLLPGGKARFGEQLVDVIASGEYVDRGQAVVVVEARGNRVLVRAKV